LGHLTCKIVSEMTYNVSSGMLNPTIPYLLVCALAVLTDWPILLFLPCVCVDHWPKKNREELGKMQNGQRNVTETLSFAPI